MKSTKNVPLKSPLRRPSKCSGAKCIVLTVICVLLLCGAVFLIAKKNRDDNIAKLEKKIKFNTTEFDGEHLHFSMKTGDCGYYEGFENTLPACKCDTVGCINIYDSGRCHVTSVNMHNANYRVSSEAAEFASNFSTVPLNFIHFGKFVASSLRKWRPHLCRIISRNNTEEEEEEDIFDPDLHDDVKLRYDSSKVYNDSIEMYNDIRAVVDEYTECVGVWNTTNVRHWRLQFRYTPLPSVRQKILGRQFFEWSGNDCPWPQVMADSDGDSRSYRFSIAVANSGGKRYSSCT